MESKPIANLKELLKHGDVTEAAKRASVSTMTVYNVLNGKHQNDLVLEVLINFIKERESKRKTVIKGLLEVLK